MNKPFFALSTLASTVGLVTILVATGCSDDATRTTGDATEPAGGGKTPAPPQQAPAPPKTPDDSNNNNGNNGGGDPSSTTCMDTKPFDATTVEYHPPAVKAGSCTTADIKTVTEAFQASSVDIEEIKTTLGKKSKTCGECVFGDAEAETWAPIVLDGSNAMLNGGGCISVVSKKDACGKAYQQWNTCLNEVCAACSDPSESNTCKNDAQQGPCTAASKALIDGCGKNVNDHLKKCFADNPVGTVVEQLCGTPSKE